MSALSRLPLDVRRAVVDGRWAREEAEHRRIRDAQRVTRAEMISAIHDGFQTAAMIVADVHACRANRRTDPLRYAIDLTKEADKRSMLAAQIADIGRLLRDLGAEAGRAAMS